MLGGQLFVGSAGTAGEIGHVSINARGPVCRCGNRGCVELSAGGRALVEHARLSYPDIADVADLVTRATRGDPGCRRLLSDAAAAVAVTRGELGERAAVLRAVVAALTPRRSWANRR